MNTNQKGLKGLLKTLDVLHDLGFTTFLPTSDYSPVDLIAMDVTGNVTRLQVKYRSKQNTARNPGRYEIKAASIVNGKQVPIDRALIDGWAVYLADDDRVVFLSIDEFQTTVKYLKGDEPAGNINEWR